MDALTQLVLDCQVGRQPLTVGVNAVLEATYRQLRRSWHYDEEAVSDFLEIFQPLICGLIHRFNDQGLPFRHYLLRTLHWQWLGFRAKRTRERRQDWILCDSVCEPEDDSFNPEALYVREHCEPEMDWQKLLAGASLADPVARNRLLLLVLKASPDLSDAQLESICHQTGTDLAWLQACCQRLRQTMEPKLRRRKNWTERQSHAWYQRILAENEARQETDPQRRANHEHRAQFYRQRLAHLRTQRRSSSISPSHRDLAHLLNIPKGTIDSGLYHLKNSLRSLYIEEHDDSAGLQQCSQKNRARGPVSQLQPPPAL